ncbi:MAG TPA: putative zinc-binding peptidase [Blastocatellia bacterium]|nr:putative zinc-binding peptidase [Blastocatellia bacterium]
MRIFRCDSCQHLVFFENIQCINCHHLLAFLPDLAFIGALEPADSGRWRLRSAEPGEPGGGEYRLCRNYEQEQVCNWAVPAADPNPFCQSCRLTRTIPNLSQPGNRESWYRLEVAKRRLIYSLLQLDLPLEDKLGHPERGLAFEFLADLPGSPPVLTGHNQGVITINIAEADDAERENRRIQLREPYRTLLGHFRHESGHYYWDRLLRDHPRLADFRQLFGDEREDYGQALKRYYDSGTPEGWQQQFISAYASAHPWEDWAETWAHYLHMTDVLETAAACGLAVRPGRPDEPALKAGAPPRTAGLFERLTADWFSVTYVLNNLNRSLGLPDGYPFILSPPVVEKLRFVHETIGER